MFGGGSCGVDLDEIDGKDEVERAQYQLIRLKFEIAKDNPRTVTHCVEGWPVDAVGRECVVVTVNDGQGIWEDKGDHVKGLAGRNADCDKALPCAACGGSACTRADQGRSGHVEHSLDGCRTDKGFIESGGMRDNGNVAYVGVHGMGLRVWVGGHQIGGGQMLRREDAVHGFEGELAPAVKKVGEVRLAESGLPREERDAQCAALDSAHDFKAEALVHLGNVHVWKVHHQQWRQMVAIFLEQRDIC